MRLLFGLLLVCLVLAGRPASSSAGLSSSASAIRVLGTDPFLASATVTTQFPTGSHCPCDILVNCASQPKGLDCASPANCCHCAGVNPALRVCIGNSL